VTNLLGFVSIEAAIGAATIPVGHKPLFELGLLDVPYSVVLPGEIGIPLREILVASHPTG
jgi:hypothetical protein